MGFFSRGETPRFLISKHSKVFRAEKCRHHAENLDDKISGWRDRWGVCGPNHLGHRQPRLKSVLFLIDADGEFLHADAFDDVEKPHDFPVGNVFVGGNDRLNLGIFRHFLGGF